VWYFFRELDYEHITELREIGDKMATAATMMTNTSVSARVLGSAWPGHFNKAIAEAMDENIKQVGLPTWTDADQKLAKALQGEIKAPTSGLAIQLRGIRGPATDADRNSNGGSDDIGDVSWTVPTVVLNYPANIPNLPGHNWANAIAMATPIAHKGTTAGAKAMAMTLVDLFTKPELVKNAWDYFRNEQTKTRQYQPLISPTDKPATWLNTRIMGDYRERMRKFYYDPAKYDTYLDQLGIQYPTVRSSSATTSGGN
jgi:aminobenzoyl-glutamate utilization protein B